MTDDAAALAAALRAVLRDFDREPPDDYMPEAVRIFLAALAAHPPAPTCDERVMAAVLHERAYWQERLAAPPSPLPLDVERARLVFHGEYERDESGYRYSGCQHKNQHRSTWDCQRRVEDFAAEYARLATPEPTEEERT